MNIELRTPSRSDRPPKWEVRVIEQNTPAQAFWRTTIADYTHDVFEETLLDDEDWRGPVFSLDNRRSVE